MASADDVQLRTLSPLPVEGVSVSLAHASLQGNLKASEADAGLKKRKSWLGSMRDVFHRSALQAKAAVDMVRGEQQSRHEEETQQTIHHDTLITPEPRESLDSAVSTMNLRPHASSPQLNRRRTFSPREAVVSFRQHLPKHGSRSKRGKIYPIAGRIGSDGEPTPRPDKFSSPRAHDGDEGEQHRRKGSITGSLVGSIRGLARRPTKTCAITTPEPRVSGEAAAEDVPLPSSPINIPSAAPVLGLDLGQPGMNFGPAELTGTSENVRDEAALNLQGPADFAFDDTTTATKSSLPLVPDEVKAQYTHPAIRQRPITPSEMLLRLPAESVRPDTPPPPPTTPLPGTNMGMDLDGASDGASSGKKSHVFERSVTPTVERDRSQLRSLRSLDAIAEACSTARNDPVVRADEDGRGEHLAGRSPASGISLKSNPFSPRISIPSASTMSACPSDMPPLERQKSEDSKVYCFGVSKKPSRDWTTAPIPIEDPFEDRNAASHGPPSPTRSVKLPLRLRIKGPSDESGSGTEALQLPPIPVHEQQDITQYTFGSPSKSHTLYEQRGDIEQHMLRNSTVAQNLSSIDHSLASPASPKRNEVLSDDDTMTRAQSLWNSDVVYPSYEYPVRSDHLNDEADEAGLSPHGGPMVPPPLCQRSDASPSTSPSKSMCKAGLGDGFRFSIDTWRGPQPLPDPQPPSTPQRRSMDVSIDSVSANDEAFETPLGSRTSTSKRTPTMGNKLEFELKRSNRNMRYNALGQKQTELQESKEKSSSPVRMHARFVFGDSTGDMDPNEAQYFPDYSTAYEGAPVRGDGEVGQAKRISSEDSITMSLRSASDNMERLRALLRDEDSDGEEARHGGEIVDAFTTASSPPRSKVPALEKEAAGMRPDLPFPGHDVADPRPTSSPPRRQEQMLQATGARSDSPSPEVNPSHPLPTTPVLEPFPFSPAESRYSQPLNRFTLLDVEVDIISSPASDDTATALPTLQQQQGFDDDDGDDGDGGNDADGDDDDESKENRLVPSDTMDRAVAMLSSPDSGYRADDSSEVATSGSGRGKEVPRRYRSARGRMALGEVSGNRV